MPWRESCIMDERIRFIADVDRDEEAIAALCRRYGISRKTGYVWLARYRSEGPAGLVDRSHAPHEHGRVTSPALREAILALRAQRPSWGPRKLIAKLSALQPEIAWPSASTAGMILKRAGLVEARRASRRAPPRLGALTEPCHANHVWAADYKGTVRLGDGSRLDPLTVTDSFSRYLVALSASRRIGGAEAIGVFDRAFDEYGLPAVIRTDNGPPFAAPGPSGLTRLTVGWIKLGIRPERIDPGKPTQNGRHERLHLTLNETLDPPAKTLAEQARRFRAFRHDYNTERPHQAIGQKPPATLFAASPRQKPRRPLEPDYPDTAHVRTVRANGEIKWRGSLVYLSTALAGEHVAIEDDGHPAHSVRFFDIPIGRIDPDARRLAKYTSHNDNKGR
jgi:putative transposase